MRIAIINEKTFEKARNEIRKAKQQNKEVAFSSSDDDLNRKVLEKERVDALLIPLRDRKDFQKQRNSGLNQVLAKLARKNNVAIGISLDELIGSAPREKSDILARIRQNVKLCNKNKLKMKFIALDGKNNRNAHDLKALGLVLGMPTWMTRDL